MSALGKLHSSIPIRREWRLSAQLDTVLSLSDLSAKVQKYE